MAASDRRLRANRANAARSTGPRTRAGKAVARLNALRHGLAAVSHYEPGADQEIEALAHAIVGPKGDPSCWRWRAAFRMPSSAYGGQKCANGPRDSVARLESLRADSSGVVQATSRDAFGTTLSVGRRPLVGLRVSLGFWVPLSF